MTQEARLKFAGIPKRFADADLADFPEHAEQVREWMDGDDWACLALVGPVGTGKTHLGCAIAKEYCKRRNAIYTTAYNMNQKIISDRNADGFNKYPLLIVDEITRSFETKSEAARMFDLINYRYENLLPMVILGNQSIDATLKALGQAIADRLKENLSVITLAGKSRR